jgi:hypothetical protein
MAEDPGTDRQSRVTGRAVADDQPEFRHTQVTVAGSSQHVIEAGDPDAIPFLFLRGWPDPVPPNVGVPDFKTVPRVPPARPRAGGLGTPS